jgi:hypothetical protein
VAGAGVVGEPAIVGDEGERAEVVHEARFPLEAAVYGYESCSANGT